MPIKNDSPDPRLAEMRKGFLEACGDLWDSNQERFMALLNASEKQTVNLTFTAAIDLSETEALMDVEMRYGKPYKDKRTCTFGDPDQNELPFDGRRPGTGLPETGEAEALDATPEGFKERREEEASERENHAGKKKAKKAKSKK